MDELKISDASIMDEVELVPQSPLPSPPTTQAHSPVEEQKEIPEVRSKAEEPIADDAVPIWR